jgi:hypothetical protein
MTPKERAIELLIKMGFIEGELMAMNYIAKRNALITIEYCLETSKYMPLTLKYWEEVKEEVDKF